MDAGSTRTWPEVRSQPLRTRRDLSQSPTAMEQQALRHVTAPVRPSPPRVTPLELAAAEQLIHLSESSCSSGVAFTPWGGPAHSFASAASASSSSPRSVNAPALAPPRDPVEDEQEVGGRPRRNKRYRPIAEIYSATPPTRARRRKDKVAGARERGIMDNLQGVAWDR